MSVNGELTVVSYLDGNSSIPLLVVCTRNEIPVIKDDILVPARAEDIDQYKHALFCKIAGAFLCILR